ncbi:MAG TPA: guanylate kinase [Terriglobales bacterium]|nr:guanylate kinase [Terriglobales bacterium]
MFIISAPSGSGKTSLTNELLKFVPDLEFSVSYTTRKPRGSEQNGREYSFVSREEFERMIANDEFLEYADVFGNYYGTARRFLQDAKNRGKDLVLDIDVQGAKQVKERLPDSVSIFILPPSRDELERRLRARSSAEQMTDTRVINRRLAEAGREIENYPGYDYILVNDDFNQSVDRLKAIVQAVRNQRKPGASHADLVLEAKADECRRRNVQERAQQILASFGLSAVPN